MDHKNVAKIKAFMCSASLPNRNAITHADKMVFGNWHQDCRAKLSFEPSAPLLCAEAGIRPAAPFPALLSPLAASFFRRRFGQVSLDEAEHFLHNRDASVVTLRWCSGSSQNAVRIHPDSAFGFAAIPLTISGALER
jgi:hypothetical protein